MSTEVVTRFAPSPTGMLHIGGARTALFNWLYARGRGGKMLLRIEDTDRARSTDEAITAIFDGLRWLGLNWDDEPVFQASRAERHRAVAEQLLSDGKAYRCFATAEELAEMRETARAEGRPPRYDGRWRDRDPAEAPRGAASVIRFKAPQAGKTIIEDRVQGRVTFSNSELDDLVLLRSDGSSTYMLSVVVDDFDMGITHVIRGDDHLTNAARQHQIYEALGWAPPQFAHIPLIHGPDGAKLSKRHGALGVEAYRAMGYLPEAMRNYLVRLGWAHGDDEIISTEQMLAWFDLDAIGRSPARFDFAKLENLNGHYIRAKDDETLFDAFIAFLPHSASGAGLLPQIDERKREQLRAAIPGLKPRAKTLEEMVDNVAFLFAQRPITLEDTARALLDDAAIGMLGRMFPRLESARSWTSEALESVVRDFAEVERLKLGKVAQPLRAALTGSTVSPGIFDVMAILGREEVLARLRDQLFISG